jgi:multidrug resistance protein, MATE family
MQSLMPASDKSRLWLAELKATIRLAWPMVLTNLAQTAMGATDVLMLGRLGPDELAGGAVATNLYFLTFFLGFGLMLAVAPVLAEEIGAFKHEIRRVRQTVRHGLWLAVLVPLPIWTLLWNGEAILLWTGQEPKIATLAGSYLHMLQWALMPFYGYIVLRNFVSVLERPKSAMIISLCAVAFNALANWVLIFGHLGLPAMGIRGSGLATALTSFMMFAALAAVVSLDRQFRRYHLFGRLWRIDVAQFRTLLRLGVSIGLLLLFETALFSISGLMMGTIGRDSVAAYAIALQIASITFMIPLGLSQAATVRVGLAYGAREPDAIRRAGWTSFCLGTSFMAMMALIMIAIPETLIGLFLDKTDPKAAPVFALGVTFLAYAALFQIVDGAQSVAGGMLRGLQDTRVPLIMGGIGYWLIGMPFGTWLAFKQGFEGRGIWLGLAIGLAFVAVTLLWRWIRVTARLEADFATRLP